MQPDGYLKIKDRSKDINHLGRREHLLARSRGRPLPPPGVLAAAVVARPDEKWGETPCAFVE